MTSCPHGVPHRWACEKCDAKVAPFRPDVNIDITDAIRKPVKHQRLFPGKRPANKQMTTAEYVAEFEAANNLKTNQGEEA